MKSDLSLGTRMARGEYVTTQEMFDWLRDAGFGGALEEVLLRCLRERGIVECHTYPGVTRHPDWRLTVTPIVARYHAKIIDAELRLANWGGE